MRVDMTRDNSPDEHVRAAIEGLTSENLDRLYYMARRFDSRRHEDLLHEAIRRTLSGERRWRDGVEIFWHLYGCMRSIAWEWSKKRDENFILEPESGTDDRDATFLKGISAAAPDPERLAASELA